MEIFGLTILESNRDFGGKWGRETMLSGSQGAENLENAEKYKVAHPY